MTKISAYLPGFDEKSQSSRQADAANQRDSWLRQMELAQLSEMNQAGALNLPGASANKPAPSASWSAILHPHAAVAKDEPKDSSAPALPQSHHYAVQAGDQGAAPADAQAGIASDNDPADDAATQIQEARPPAGTREPQSLPASTAADVHAQAIPDTASGAAKLDVTPGAAVAADFAVAQHAPAASGVPAAQPAPAATEVMAALPASEMPAAQSAPAATGATAPLPAPASSETPATQIAPVAPMASDMQATQPAPAEFDTQPAPAEFDTQAAPADTTQPAAAASDAQPDHAPAQTGAQRSARDQAQATGASGHTSSNAFQSPDAAARAGKPAPAVATTAAHTSAVQAPAARQSIDLQAIQPAQSRVTAPSLLPAAMADGNQQEAISAPDETPSEEAPGTDAPLEEKPTWQKRLMHMTGEGKDVKLWIRDSQLGTAQSQNLVNRLANDIAGMGMRLKDATVNGKLAFRSDDEDDTPGAPGTRTRRSGAMRSQGGVGIQQAIDSTNPTMEEEHGTQ